VFLDLMMPRLDGEQFLNQIRASRFPDIPVVIMSGHSRAAKKADQLKALSCLMKPFEADDLLKIVRRFALPASTHNVA
jgi:CheY-like chemotaxis protein